MSLALGRIDRRGNYASIRVDDEKTLHENTSRVKQAFQRGLESYGQFSLHTIPIFTCNLMHSCFCGTWNLIKNNSVSIRISNNITWMIGRVKEVASKANEIPYFIRHPRLIIKLYYRQRVKDAMMNLEPTQIKTKLSQILPAHPIEGNSPAVNKNRERVLALKKYKQQFANLFCHHKPITKEWIERIMQSTSPMQFAFGNHTGKYITFSGNSRLIALKLFCSEEFPNLDPEIEIPIYLIDPRLIDDAGIFS
ncbi:MAG: hypothetical protein V4487_03685 [Chlamydiota bacterium]